MPLAPKINITLLCSSYIAFNGMPPIAVNIVALETLISCVD